MNTNKVKNKTMNALQYMKEAESMQQLMESIADETIKQHGAMLENANFEDPTTDNDGVFDMNSMLDVVGSDTEQNQPRIYNTPQEDLTEEEKDLVVSEYQKYLATIQDKIIDINNLDVAETVIKPIIGTTKPLVGFLADIINKAANYATSKNSEVASETGNVSNSGDGSPTDIAPQVDTGAGVGGEVPATSAPVMDEVPAIGDVSSELSKLDSELGGSIGDNGALGDVGVADVAPVEDLGVDINSDVAPVEDVAPEAGEGEEVAGEDLEEAGEGEEEVGEDLEEAGEGEEEVGEDLEEAGEDEDEDVKLEAIKNNYLNTLVESKIDSKLEAIKSKILTESVGKKTDATKAKLEAIASNYHKKVIVESAEMKVTAQLEAIAKNLKAKKAGKTEVSKTVKTPTTVNVEKKSETVVKDAAKNLDKKQKEGEKNIEKKGKKVEVELEAIANQYKALVEGEAKLDNTLNTIIESYQSTTNLKARQEAKNKLSA